MENMPIRKATTDDAERIYHLQCEVYPPAYWEDISVFQHIIACGFSLVYTEAVAGSGNEIAGYMLVHPIEGTVPRLGEVCAVKIEAEGELFIHDLCVKQNIQGRGIGSRLLAYLTARFPDIDFVGISLQTALGFWKRNGFIEADCDEDIIKIIKTYGHGSIYIARRAPY